MDQIEGTIWKNNCDRYEVDGHVFSCRSPIQVYHEKSGQWLVGRVEHAHSIGGYYFYSEYREIPSFPLAEGMMIRVGFPKGHVAPWMVAQIIEDVRFDLIEALREKNKHPDRYKKEAEEAYRSLGRFLGEIEKLPYFDGIGD